MLWAASTGDAAHLPRRSTTPWPRPTPVLCRSSDWELHRRPRPCSSTACRRSPPKRPLPIVCQPEIAFQTLFGRVAQGDAGKAFQARKKLLDWCRSDVRRVRDELPSMDREKLDVDLDTFEQIRTRLDKVAALKDSLKVNIPAVDKFNGKVITERFEAQCVIAAATLASRLTKVFTLDASGVHFPHGIPSASANSQHGLAWAWTVRSDPRVGNVAECPE
ncbi:MAG: DUF1552 domain-containing protein [Gemmataceae bacterium]